MIAQALNSLDLSQEVTTSTVTDAIVAQIIEAPGLVEWAVTICVRESVNDRVHRHLLATRSGATRVLRRRRRAIALQSAVTASGEVRRKGGTIAEAKSVFLTMAYCVDESHGRWKPLSQMTRLDLEYVAGRREEQGKRMLLEAAFLRVLARRVKRDQTVEEVFTEEEILRIRDGIGISAVA